MEYSTARLVIAAVLFVAILGLVLVFRGRIEKFRDGRLATSVDVLVGLTAFPIAGAAVLAAIHYLA